MIDIHEIDSMEILLDTLNSLPNHFIYRGHADASWPLTSSLERVIGSSWNEENAILSEERTLDVFKSKFHLYDKINIVPDSKLAWLSLMQHYGAPTRLLDFTESPYAALYFSIEFYCPQSKKDFAVYALDYSAMMDKSIAKIAASRPSFNETRASIYPKRDAIFDEVVDPGKYDIAWITEPTMLNARLDRQAGSFILSGNRGSRIRDILESELYHDVAMYKYVFPAKLYQGVYALLRKMNLTSKTLYGDLDGLARSLKMELQVYLGQ